VNNSPFFLLSFSIAEKETKKLDNKNLPARKARSTARFIVRPTLAKEEAFTLKYLNIAYLDSENCCYSFTLPIVIGTSRSG